MASAKKALEDVTQSLKDIRDRHVAPLIATVRDVHTNPLQVAQAKAGLALLLASTRFMSPRLRNGDVPEVKSQLRQDLNHMRTLVVSTMKKKPKHEEAVVVQTTTPDKEVDTKSQSDSKTETDPTSAKKVAASLPETPQKRKETNKRKSPHGSGTSNSSNKKRKTPNTSSRKKKKR